MISFRVSEREFEALRVKSEAEGARNVSDFARLALCGHTNGQTATPSADIDQLRDELQQLNAKVRRVTELLEQRQSGLGPRAQLAAVGRKTGRV